jgi:replicative DNA helicase
MASSDFEVALITSAIEEKAIREVVRQKITTSFFFSTRTRAIFVWLLDWYKNPEYSDTPSWEMFMDTFPDFEPESTHDSITALCTKVREQKLYSDVANSLQHVADVTQGDPVDGLSELKKQTARLSVLHTVDDAVDARDKIDDIRQEYLAMKTGKTGLKGKPYPWPTLNDATLGCQDGQIIVIYGRPKTYKTWVALRAMQGFHEAGGVPLICSQELTDIEIARRFVAMSSGVEYRAFTRGELPEDVEESFMRDLDSFAKQQPVIIDQLIGMGDQIEIELTTKIDETGCNCVLVDGAHTLGRDWKELGLLTRTLKRVAKRKNVPIIVTTHAHRRGGKPEVGGTADDIAHSDSFFQDCDVALRLVCDIENRRAKEVVLWTAAIREGESCGFVINMKLAEDLSEKKQIILGEPDDPEEAIDGAALDGEEDERG